MSETERREQSVAAEIRDLPAPDAALAAGDAVRGGYLEQAPLYGTAPTPPSRFTGTTFDDDRVRGGGTSVGNTAADVVLTAGRWSAPTPTPFTPPIGTDKGS
jgi:hypothetical protein